MRVQTDERDRPKKWHEIYCFDCAKRVPSKAKAAANHKGHDVDYLDEKGERMS